MKKERKIWILVFLLLGFALVHYTSCKKENEITDLPASIKAVDDEISDTRASFAIDFFNEGSTNVTRGVCWSLSGLPTLSDVLINDSSFSRKVKVVIDGLNPGTTYYLRPFETKGNNIGYGNLITFTTKGSQGLITSQITNISDSGAICNSIFKGKDTSRIDICGVCWNKNSIPNINDDRTIDSFMGSGFKSEIYGLTANTKYNVRAYIIKGNDVIYGNTISFTTQNAQIPSLSTLDAKFLSDSLVICSSRIISDGGFKIKVCGVCWGTNLDPTIADNKTIQKAENPTYQSYIFGFEPNKKYYVRAYATNSAGTAYGNILSFTTKAKEIKLPELTTIQVDTITYNSAVSGGNIISSGGEKIKSCGVCWSTKPIPTINDNKTVDFLGIKWFISYINGLKPSTKYYVRAYATNSAGVAYGNEQSFTTHQMK